MKTSRCCNAPVLKAQDGKKSINICANCKKVTQRNSYPKLMHSDKVSAYIKSTELVFDNARTRNLWKFLTNGMEPSHPVFIGIYLLRQMDNEWDFNNASQIVTDLLQKYGYVTTDSVRNLIPMYIGHHKFAENPGMILLPLRAPFEMIRYILNHTYEYYTENNLTL